MSSEASNADENRSMSGSASRRRFLEPSPYQADDGQLIGRHPFHIAAHEWRGREFLSGLKAIRAKCLDCCGGSQAEVRKCVSVDCVLWPLRMGAVPKAFREGAA